MRKNKAGGFTLTMQTVLQAAVTEGWDAGAAVHADWGIRAKAPE